MYKMYNGKNLLSIHASAINKYITAVTKFLWTEKELAIGFITDNDATSTSKQKMDLERVLLLKGFY